VQKNNPGSITFLDLKSYCRITETQNRHIDQGNRRRDPETRKSRYCLLILHKSAKNTYWKKDTEFNS
jgi:hypothetical protein